MKRLRGIVSVLAASIVLFTGCGATSYPGESRTRTERQEDLKPWYEVPANTEEGADNASDAKDG